jgi:hypothetical protein
MIAKRPKRTHFRPEMGSFLVNFGLSCEQFSRAEFTCIPIISWPTAKSTVSRIWLRFVKTALVEEFSSPSSV